MACLNLLLDHINFYCVLPLLIWKYVNTSNNLSALSSIVPLHISRHRTRKLNRFTCYASVGSGDCSCLEILFSS